MEIKVLSDSYNPLLLRRELVLSIKHENSATPALKNVREEVSKMFNSELNRVYVISIRTKTGMNESIAQVDIYDTEERAKRVLHRHIILRNEGKKEEGGE